MSLQQSLKALKIAVICGLGGLSYKLVQQLKQQHQTNIKLCQEYENEADMFMKYHQKWQTNNHPKRKVFNEASSVKYYCQKQNTYYCQNHYSAWKRLINENNLNYHNQQDA
tara:strand:+ start:16537 stop:16869 length:333 start_codon:yes stop_codon:yes gene_type:complete